MVAVWSQTLLSAAEVSNFFSALGVVVCFICMVVFILRVQGIELASPSVIHVGQPSPVQVNFEKVGIPFVCFLKANVSSDELHFTVTIDVPCYLQVFWCVPALELKDFLYMPWESFAEKLDATNSLQAKRVEYKRFLEPEQANETRIINLTRDASYASLGQAPRMHFPLVVVLSRKEKPFDAGSNVGALISVIHISDEDCPMPTTILYQYLKQYSGQLSQLRTLYTQKSESSSHEREESSTVDSLASRPSSSSLPDPFNNEVSEDEACVICRVTKPTRALLPCRHVCVCSFCFSHVDVCPLCRSRISAYFLTDPQEEDRQAVEMEARERVAKENSGLDRHRSFLNNMNGVLNSLLGLRDA